MKHKDKNKPWKELVIGKIKLAPAKDPKELELIIFPKAGYLIIELT